jgi:hypothetical protein
MPVSVSFTANDGIPQVPTHFIRFSTRGSPGVRLPDALRGNIKFMDNKDGFPFDALDNGVCVRIQVGF